MSIKESRDVRDLVLSETISLRDFPERWRGFTFDPAGRLSALYEKDAAGDSFPQQTFVSAQQVVQFATSAMADRRDFQRDQIGSLDEIATTRGSVYSATHAASGRLTSVTLKGNQFAVTHDSTGRLKKAGAALHDFDAVDRLVRVRDTTAQPSTNEFYYRDDGRLAAVKTGSEWSIFVWDGDQIAAAYSKTGTRRWDIVWGAQIDEPLAFAARTGEEVALLSDSRGSPIAAIVNGVVGRQRFDQHGLVQTSSCPPANADACNALAVAPVSFAGLMKVVQSDVLYARNRWYSPRLKQFLSVDPKGFVDAMNVYAYAGFDPVNMRDPFGSDRKGPADAGGPLTDVAELIKQGLEEQTGDEWSGGGYGRPLVNIGPLPKPELVKIPVPDPTLVAIPRRPKSRLDLKAKSPEQGFDFGGKGSAPDLPDVTGFDFTDVATIEGLESTADLPVGPPIEGHLREEEFRLERARRISRFVEHSGFDEPGPGGLVLLEGVLKTLDILVDYRAMKHEEMRRESTAWKRRMTIILSPLPDLVPLVEPTVGWHRVTPRETH